MGLAERRALDAFKAGQFVELSKEVEQAAGAAIPIDVRWETLTSSASPDNYAGWIKDVYFTPLIQAIKAVAVDDMGKQALAGGLKKVVIDGSAGINPANFSFNNGELVIKHVMDANVADVKDRAKAIQQLFESKL